ncbi:MULTISPECIES: hypothetical protein [Tsukamurella]|uniref:Uncharacterized protein n=2 Tax=Tsukamurella TaxID=2060 RepID=A0A5C5S543_9ACTN|nr:MULTISPECIES: hypothetical protein [Tsukamurella]NMD56693.1 hypothetical protein [Tsukamurella columbiensis]TWS30349.1 hypothetical protein FK530_00220 [Tsukamurella conjunctivitidis]
MFRPARPEATVRGVAVGAVSFAASLTAHAVAMRTSSMPGHAMPAGATPHHVMPSGSMPQHVMPDGSVMSGSTMGHDMGGHAMHSMPSMDMTAMPGAPSVPLSALLLLAAVCAVLGAVAARPRTAGPRGVAALLLLGQGAGHLALGVTMGHLAMSPVMAVAHVGAAIVAGAVIAGAEHALRVALATLTPLTPTWRTRARPVVAPVWTFRAVPLPVLARHGALRAPPC